MGLLRAEAPAPSELLQMLDAVAVWRTFGKDSPRLAVDLHLKTQAMRNQFIGELASIKANDPHGGYDAVFALTSPCTCWCQRRSTNNWCEPGTTSNPSRATKPHRLRERSRLFAAFWTCFKLRGITQQQALCPGRRGFAIARLLALALVA